MSRCLGQIEQALVKIFDNERDNAFTIEDLCERIWPDLYPGGRPDQEEAPRHRHSSGAPHRFAATGNPMAP